MTAAECGTLLGGISAKTILQYARDGRLPCVHVGKHVRFVRSQLEAALLDVDVDRRPGSRGASSG
jgi:excisionase family DNA binding protein